MIPLMKRNQAVLQDMPVPELFKLYQEQIYKNAKKSEMDYIKESFSRTELFDFSNIKFSEKIEYVPIERDGLLIAPLVKDIAIPFESCFIKVYKDEHEMNSVFIKEYSPEILTGASFMVNNEMGNIIQVCTPFTINLNSLNLVIEQKVIDKLVDAIMPNREAIIPAHLAKRFLYTTQFRDVATLIQLTTKVLDSLNQHAVMVDHLKKPEYYTFKDRKKPTIKRENRPIYYVMEKKTYENVSYKIKPYTHLEYTHSFAVRGHWRVLNGAAIGKDRRGVRCVKGHTWVKDYTKGNGDFIPRVRVVKGVQ